MNRAKNQYSQNVNEAQSYKSRACEKNSGHRQGDARRYPQDRGHIRSKTTAEDRGGGTEHFSEETVHTASSRKLWTYDTIACVGTSMEKIRII